MKVIVLVLCCCFTALSAFAQSSFLSRWEDRVRATTAKQPAWCVPVVTPSSVLLQLARFDAVRQITPARTNTWVVDNGKGFDFIPFNGAEFDFNLPPLIEHHNPAVVDGTGDFGMLMKYRPFSSPIAKHNYSAAFQMLFTVPTGSYKNGTAVSTITPALLGGKGIGKFVVQSALGAVLPTSSVPTIGRTIQWNTTAQYNVATYFWPELEVNASYFHGGSNDGKSQVFLTPGVMVSKIKLRKEPKDRLALVMGTGMQIAMSTYHAYNHGLVLSARLSY
jgi:hypothetical protein